MLDELDVTIEGVERTWHVYTVSLVESQCHTVYSWTRTNEIQVDNFEGYCLV